MIFYKIENCPLKIRTSGYLILDYLFTLSNSVAMETG